MLRNIVQQRYRSLIAWLLVSTFIAQVFFPIQAHTRSVKTSNGQTVVLCTLNGLKTVNLDDQGRIPVEQYQQHNQSSSAVKFSQLMGCSTPAVPVFALALTDIPDITPSVSTHVSVTVFPASLQPIRAPPSV